MSEMKIEIGKQYLLKVKSHIEELDELNDTVVTVTGEGRSEEWYIEECKHKVYTDELHKTSKLQRVLK